MSLARDIADLGAVTSRLDTVGASSGALSNRNLIINGAMQVAQRATTATGVGDTNAVYPTLDRYRYIIGGSSTGRFTMSQEADGPVGFANSLKMACTTADTSIAADERMFLQHKIEAQDCQAIGKGETGAKPITVSFYVKADSAKTYGLEVFESNSSRQCTKLFNVTTDWTRVVLTFPADVDDGSSPIPDTTAEGIVLQWQLHAGSNFTSGTLNSSAFADNVNANRAGGIDSFYSSTSNTFFITGVQVEVGETATDFEHRSYGDELARCQRYYSREDAGSGAAYKRYGVGSWNSATHFECSVPLSTPMRITPTLETTGTASNYAIYSANAIDAVTSLNLINDSDAGTYNRMVGIIMSTSSGGVAGEGGTLLANNDDDNFLALDAEL